MMRGMTQEQLADELDIDCQLLSRVERGVRRCSIELLIAISNYFGVATDYLLMGKEMRDEKKRLLSVICDLTEIVQTL